MNWDLEHFSVVVVAGILGGIIGIEREIAAKPAGMRTHVFVASGAALLVLLARNSVEYMAGTNSNDLFESDPVRVIQAIIVGISFLGSGTIIRQRSCDSDESDVEGLTTAATIFLTAGIGIAVAVERYLLAIETTAFAVFVLIACRWIEHRLPNNREQ